MMMSLGVPSKISNLTLFEDRELQDLAKKIASTYSVDTVPDKFILHYGHISKLKDQDINGFVRFDGKALEFLFIQPSLCERSPKKKMARS